ncbi:hypothetical protein BsWGS_22898 [Bradybaena similaris]
MASRYPNTRSRSADRDRQTDIQTSVKTIANERKNNQEKQEETIRTKTTTERLPTVEEEDKTDKAELPNKPNKGQEDIQSKMQGAANPDSNAKNSEGNDNSKTKQIDEDLPKIKLTQINGETCKLSAFSDKEILNILETCFGHRSFAKINYSNKGTVVATPNKTSAIDSLIRELDSKREGVTKELTHNMRVRIEAVQPTIHKATKSNFF